MASSQRLYEIWLVSKLGFEVGLRTSANKAVLVAGEVLFADVLLLPNGMSKVGAYT